MKKFFKGKNKEFSTPYTLKNAITKGDTWTRLSLAVLGAGNIARKQYIKGILYFLLQVVYLFFMITTGIGCLLSLPGLGSVEQGEIWNEAKGVYEYTAGDNSLLILLYGVATIFLLVAFILIWRSNLKSAYKAQVLKEEGKHINSFKEDIKELFNKDLHKLLMTGPFLGIVLITVLPLVFMIAMAFTNYSTINSHLILFDWVGLVNFTKILNFNDNIGRLFYSVLSWTIVWAIFATFTNYIFGTLLAIVINRKDTKFKSFWRFCFILSIAVPQFVTLLVMRSMLQQNGAVNVLLKNLGLIKTALPFFGNATWARVTVIVINMWIGIPYTLIQVTGILQNIPTELYESAKVDGANSFTTFFKITMPYMSFVTTPYLITTFTNNINNFNVIFLLSAGDPTPVGATAGKTDLLVTWLYKLTIDRQYYNLGAVIGIMTFVVLAIVSLITYRNTNSYKDEEGFM